MTTANPARRGLKYDPTVAASRLFGGDRCRRRFLALGRCARVHDRGDDDPALLLPRLRSCDVPRSTVGLLFCSFSYATLSSVKASPSAFLHLMLNAAGLTICFLSELAGFDALARAYLPRTSVLFAYIVCGSVAVARPGRR